MANERIISADSHVAIREGAVLEHLSTKYHEGYKQSRMEYIQRMMARAKRKAVEFDSPPFPSPSWKIYSAM